MLTNGSGSGSLSVCPGGHNKLPQAGWLLNNRNVLHTFLEAGGLRSVPASLGEGRPRASDFSYPPVTRGHGVAPRSPSQGH